MSLVDGKLLPRGKVCVEVRGGRHSLLCRAANQKTNTGAAPLPPKGVVLQSESLARNQLHFIGNSNFKPGKSAFAYYRLLDIAERFSLVGGVFFPLSLVR